MKAISPNHIAEAIYLALKDKNHAEQTQIFKNSVLFLNKKKLFSKKELVLRQLRKLIDADMDRLSARVLSPKPLTEHVARDLRHALKEKYGVAHVELEEELNPGLLDGWRIEIGDEVIDLSARNKIKQLQKHLTK